MTKPTILLLALLFFATDSFARCGPLRLGGGITKPEVITLNAESRGVRDAPAFYLRMANPWVMLFFKPEDVVAWLKQPAFVQPNKYLDMISKDLPLEEDTDLFKYVLADSDLFHTQDVLVSDLLKLGQVRIDDWPFANSKRDPFYDRQDPTTVIMVSKKFDNFEEEWRLFCEPLRNKGETREIFEITYVIVD